MIVSNRVVFPEVTTRVDLSSTDVNRFVCQGPIKDVMFSQDKGIKIKISQSNAFVKFQALKRGQDVVYSKTPSEFYVVCNDVVYTLIGIPKKIPAQTIRLSSGQEEKIEKNLSLFLGMPLEKKVLKLIKQAYTDDLPESYTIHRIMKRKSLFNQAWVIAKRDILVEGEGLGVREYIVGLKDGHDKWHLSEKDFLKPALTNSPLAIAIEEPLLKAGDKTRVFIVERRNPDERNNPLIIETVTDEQADTTPVIERRASELDRDDLFEGGGNHER
jgi:conjugal transfer pilus assembly protein TraK